MRITYSKALPLLLPLAAWACSDGQLPYFSELMGPDFSCSCRNTLFNEKTTCVEDCSTCYLGLGLCAKKTVEFTTFTCFVATCQGEWDLVNQETSSTLTYGGDPSDFVTSAVDAFEETSCSAHISGIKCKSCSVGDKGCVNLDCSNILYFGEPSHGSYNCCTNEVDLGSYDIVGPMLAGIPLTCIDPTVQTAKYCDGDSLPFADPSPSPTPYPTKVPTNPPTPMPTPGPTLPSPTALPTPKPTPQTAPNENQISSFPSSYPSKVPTVHSSISPSAVKRVPTTSPSPSSPPSMASSNGLAMRWDLHFQVTMVIVFLLFL